MAGCFSTLIRAPTVPPFLLRSCANFFYRKAHGFFGRKRCWAWIQIKGRDLSRQVGAIDLNRPRVVQVNGAGGSRTTWTGKPERVSEREANESTAPTFPIRAIPPEHLLELRYLG